MPDPTVPVPVSVESEGNDGFRFEQRPTAPVPADDLRDRYTEALYQHAVTVARPTPFPPHGAEERWLATVRENAHARAAAVLAVRDEELELLRSSLAMAQEDVRAAYAEREEMWERKAAALRERDDARRELAEAKAKLDSLQAFADRCREKDWAYATERTRERDEARAERDALKATEKRVKALCEQAQAKASKFMFDVTGQPFPATVRVADVLAALAAPGGRGDAPAERPKLITGMGMQRKPSEELTPIYEDPEDAPTEETNHA